MRTPWNGGSWLSTRTVTLGSRSMLRALRDTSWVPITMSRPSNRNQTGTVWIVPSGLRLLSRATPGRPRNASRSGVVKGGIWGYGVMIASALGRSVAPNAEGDARDAAVSRHREDSPSLRLLHQRSCHLGIIRLSSHRLLDERGDQLLV